MRKKASRKSRPALVALSVLATLAVLVAAGCGGGGGAVPSNAVAVVDGQTIMRAELTSLLTRTRDSYKQNQRQFPQPGTAEYQALQQQAVSFLVRQTEYEQQGAIYKVSVTPAEIDGSVARVVKQYFKGDQKQFEAALQKQATTVDQFREQTRIQLLLNKLATAITKDVKVSDADVRAYYDKNKGSAPYSTPESRSMRHILVKTLAEANTLYAQLKAGADFATLEKQHSLDTATNNQGGIITITKGQTVPEYEAAAFTLPTGTISKPVHSQQYGYFIIKPVGTLKPATTEPFSKAAKGIRTTLLGQKRNDALTAWSTNLTKTYAKKVKYASGLAPPDTNPPTTTVAPSGHGGANGNG